MKTLIRDYVPDDKEFIIKSWARSFVEQKSCSLPKPWMISAAEALFEKILEKSTIKVLCLFDSPEIVLGYIIGDPRIRTLHYIYIKYDYRKNKFGRKLMENMFGNVIDTIEVTHWTIACSHLKHKWGLKKGKLNL
jgi:hypothetical protein